MENLISRIGRILVGNVNALVDSVEGAQPEVVMEQALREIDQAIEDAENIQGRHLAQRHLLTKQIARDTEEHEKLTGQTRVAIQESRDDLARSAVDAQIDIESKLKTLKDELAQVSTQEEKFAESIAALRAKRREMEDALVGFRTAKVSQSMTETGARGLGHHPADDAMADAKQAQSVFERAFQKATGIRPGLDQPNNASLRELERLYKQKQVDDRLAALKAGMG